MKDRHLFDAGVTRELALRDRKRQRLHFDCSRKLCTVQPKHTFSSLHGGSHHLITERFRHSGPNGQIVSHPRAQKVDPYKPPICVFVYNFIASKSRKNQIYCNDKTIVNFSSVFPSPSPSPPKLHSEPSRCSVTTIVDGRVCRSFAGQTDALPAPRIP